MRVTYKPSESELMAQAQRLLRQRHDTGAVQLLSGVDTAPYGSDLSGSISESASRRLRSLQSCHRPSRHERRCRPVPKDTGAYVPETAARMENDPNLTDGARRCARKIMEETYRRNRRGRVLSITVSYLGRALGRCRRTVQRYLQQLEEQGYLSIDVAVGDRSRLCTGLVIRLLAPLFPRHHRKRWPEKPGNSGATPESQNHRFKILVSREGWAVRCMDGVFRALMKTNPLAGLPPVRAA
jgi:hypothetical protein